MNSSERQDCYIQMMEILTMVSSPDWNGISHLLSELKARKHSSDSLEMDQFYRLIARGSAFMTFDYGIDGVSVEIGKYAQALEDLYRGQDDIALHFIGGDFYPQAVSVLKPHWQRYRIEGINGWSKWEDGKWFSALFYEDLPEGSIESKRLATEIYRQAVSIAERLGRYIVEKDISLLISVNVASNPGNLAHTLALVIVTEALGTYVINSNHDYYWEGGKPASERNPGEAPGVRDHFFRNFDNAPFRSLLQAVYPWNGRRWLQVNINKVQSNRLIEYFAFDRERVFELSTAVSDEFFREYSKEDIKHARLRMGYILSDGKPILHPEPVDTHLAKLSKWMGDQKPCILAARSGLSVNPTSDDLIYLLQPTRVITRKRIERDLHLINALLHHTPFKTIFQQKERLQLVLHITGPTPIEHQADLEVVLQSFIDVVHSVEDSIADRLFLAFSVGNENHPSFASNNLRRLTIEEIYRMASAVVFPSETEGRGLPIIEASASRIPLICSRYHPQQVFADVVGEGRPQEEQILYTLFPEDHFDVSFLDEVTELLMQPEKYTERLGHNREVVRLRFSTEALKHTFEKLLNKLHATSD